MIIPVPETDGEVWFTQYESGDWTVVSGVETTGNLQRVSDVLIENREVTKAFLESFGLKYCGETVTHPAGEVWTRSWWWYVVYKLWTSGFWAEQWLADKLVRGKFTIDWGDDGRVSRYRYWLMNMSEYDVIEWRRFRPFNWLIGEWK